VDQELHQLIQEAKQQNQQAFEELVHRFKGQVYRQAYAMLHDRMEAEDIVQEAFVKMYYGLPKLESAYAFSTWLSRIVIHLCYDHLQKRKKDPSYMVEWLDQHHNSLTNHSELFEQMKFQLSLEEAMKQLSSEHRAVVVLRDIQGYSYDEIARILKVPMGTVKSRLHAARLTLRHYMSEGEIT
jgi:RNA polymerase sigma factor (sigma-70 family)